MGRKRLLRRKFLEYTQGLRNMARKLFSRRCPEAERLKVPDAEWPRTSPSEIRTVSYLFDERPSRDPSSPVAVPMPAIPENARLGLPFDDSRRVDEWRRLTGQKADNRNGNDKNSGGDKNNGSDKNNGHNGVRVRRVRILGPVRNLYCPALPGNSAGTLFGTCDRCDVMEACHHDENTDLPWIFTGREVTEPSQESPQDDTRTITLPESDESSDETCKGNGNAVDCPPVGLPSPLVSLAFSKVIPSP